MKLAVIESLAVGLLLTCLVESLSGSPQRPHWGLPQVGIGGNYQEFGNRLPLRIDNGREHQQGSLNYPYESIDEFQLEQLNKPQNIPNQYPSRYDYEEEHYKQFRNDQEFYYQRLLTVTENPFREIENHDTFFNPQEQRAYYQDYLPLDDTEEQYDSKSTNGKLDEMNNKVKNSTEEKIAVIMTDFLTKDSYVPSLNDLNVLNSLEDEMIAEASVPDEIKREIRQVRGQQPGFLWTLAKLAFESVNDTKSAINQIGMIVNNNVLPDEPPLDSAGSAAATITTTPVINTDSNSDDISNAASSSTTTTERPFRLSRTELQGIIRRNVKGLIRLFNIEWRDALNQSQVSVRDFQRDLKNQVRPYFDNNPNVKF